MAGSAGTSNKLRILHLLDMFMKKTDIDHGMRMEEICAYIQGLGYKAERKIIGEDIESLKDMGYDIINDKVGKYSSYKLVSRDFEFTDMKILVDAIGASRFITEKKSKEIIGKLKNLLSEYDAKKLDRPVYVANRVKNENEASYIAVDEIQRAMRENKKITFKYYRWNAKGNLEITNDGKPYRVSPWALFWDNEQYYLVAVKDGEEKLKHFRVDKIKAVNILEEEREGKTFFDEKELTEYTTKRFKMYDGKIRSVELLCENSLSNVIVDQFGKGTRLIPVDEGHFKTIVDVAVSPMFHGFVFGLGTGIVINGPEEEKQKMKNFIKEVLKQYQ